MVQIPEYTRRENARPVQRGGMNLSLPDALVKPVGTEAIEKGLKLSKELADVYVNMKERRDDGIVSGFLNQYSKDAEAKLLELEDKYRGQNSQKVMSEFQKWRDDYIAQHSSYDPDSAKEGVIYLENAAQNRLAKQKLDAYNVRDINSISAYIANEEEKFRVNNLTTSIDNLLEKIVGENNPYNVMSLKEDVKSNVYSLYKGQPKNYLDKIVSDDMDLALSGNIMRDSATNPMASIDRFEYFGNEISEKAKQKLYLPLLKSFKDYQAQQLANAQTGRPSNPAGNDFYTTHASFFGGGINDLKRQIEEESVKLANSMLEKDERDRVAVLNNLSIQLIDSQSNRDTQQMAEVLSAMSGVRGGVETAQIINDVDKEYNDYRYLLNQERRHKSGEKGPWPGWRPEKEIKERLDVYRKRKQEMEGKLYPVIEDINNDRYETLLDIPDFDNFAPNQKEEILTSFARRARYNSLIATANDKSSINFEGRIKEIFKNERGDPNKNPVEYNRFNLEMSKQIVRFLSENPNKIPEAKDLQLMARSAVTTSTSVVNKPEYDIFVKIAQTLNYKDIKDNKTERRDYATLFRAVRKELDSHSKGLFRSVEEKEALDVATAYYIEGDWERAYNELADVGLLERHEGEE